MLTRIAFQGERGSFAEDAIFGFFEANEVEIIACATLETLRESLENSNADFAVLPIENSLVGEVESVKKLLKTVEWQIVKECQLLIKQNLVACLEAELENIQTVESHKVALAQCANFFAKHPQLKKAESVNTALSAKRAIESRNITLAAIANARTADIYGGKILLENIQDNNRNYTKFYLLKK